MGRGSVVPVARVAAATIEVNPTDDLLGLGHFNPVYSLLFRMDLYYFFLTVHIRDGASISGWFGGTIRPLAAHEPKRCSARICHFVEIKCYNAELDPDHLERGRDLMAVSRVKFEGNGPFYLRTVEHAKASVLANTIQLSLFAVVDGSEQARVQIETQMTLRAAEELASTLSRALECNSRINGA